MANLGRLKTLRETVISRQDEWDQQDWARKYSCGTTMCLAGWASALAGKTIDWDQARRLSDGSFAASQLATGEWIEHFAADWLGLEPEEAYELFHSYTQGEALHVLDTLIAVEEEALNVSID